MRRLAEGLVVLFMLAAPVAGAAAAAKTPVVLNALLISAEYRETVSQLVRRFNAAHPEIALSYKLFLNEDYHDRQAACLGDPACPVDIFLGFAGYGFEQRVARGEIAPIDDLWARADLDKAYPGTKASVSLRDKPYGLPLSYYPWGFFYRKSLFTKLGLAPPQTWAAFLQVCAAFKAAGIAPMIIGTKTPFPAASWFSHVNLRRHGLAFHTDLTAGKIPFTDPRVRTTLEVLKNLIDKGYFFAGHENLTHAKALPYFYRNRGGMYLIGSFILSKMPKQFRGDVGFFRFPEMDAAIPPYEEAPLNVLFIPAQSRHKAAAKKVLAFFARADVSHELNQASGYLSPNALAPEVDDPLVLAASRHLKSSAGFSYFFNRNSPPETGRAGTKLLGRFFKDPGDLDAYIREFEALRATIKN